LDEIKKLNQYVKSANDQVFDRNNNLDIKEWHFCKFQGKNPPVIKCILPTRYENKGYVNYA
jgi:hypothetical protein